MVGDDHVVGKRAGLAFDPSHGVEHSGSLVAQKFAGVELRQHVVNVQNDFCAGQLRNQCGENEEIRNGMDVHQIIGLPQVIKAQNNHGPQEKHANPEKVRELTLFIGDALLHAQYTDTVAKQRALFLSVVGDDVHFVATPGERFCIPHYAVISLIKRVRHHANSHAASVLYLSAGDLRASAVCAKYLPLHYSTTILTASNSREIPNLGALFPESGAAEPAAVACSIPLF